MQSSTISMVIYFAETDHDRELRTAYSARISHWEIDRLS